MSIINKAIGLGTRTITSVDPNKTSGREGGNAVSLSYPLNESLSRYTMLRFVQYTRFEPKSNIETITTATIQLPIPNQIPENIQIKTGATDVGYVGNLNNIYDKASGSTLSDIISSSKDQFSDDVVKNSARAIALSPSIFGDDAKKSAELSAGLVKNPHTTSFFDGVNLRTFNLTWRFSARNQNESNMINNIINLIRERMHPEESLSGYSLDYPDLVYVDFEGDVKPYLPQYNRSFITNMNINTSSGDGTIFYKSGAPIFVEIMLTFAEINIITRNTLRKD